jgi:lysophospholipase L1-like esterase
MIDLAPSDPRPFIDLSNNPAVKYWLDAAAISGVADGATIAASNWRDLSSFRRGGLASATACIYRRDGGNGRPAVEFNGATSIAKSLSFAVAQPMRVFMVARPITLADNARYIDGGTTQDKGAIDMGAPGQGNPARIWAGSAWACLDYSHTLGAGIWRLFDAVFNGASSSLALEFNTAKTGNPGTLGYPDGVTLGCRADGGAGLFANFALAELAICDASALHGDMVTAIKRQMLRKHRIPINGALIANGSSLTSGVGATAGNDWPSVLHRLLGTTRWAKQNFAVGAQTTPQAATYATSHADVWASIFAQSFMFLDGGSFGNDILLNNPGAAAAYNNYVSYFTGRQTAGFARSRCVAFTAGPRSDVTGPREADRQTVNASIRSNWPSFAGALVDIDADPRLATPAHDGVHYNDAQYAVFAENVLAAMRPLIAA